MQQFDAHDVHAIASEIVRVGEQRVLFDEQHNDWYAVQPRGDVEDVAHRIGDFCRDVRGTVLLLTVAEAAKRVRPEDGSL